MREAAMEYAACNVVYVDRTASEDRLVKRNDATSATSANLQDHDADVAVKKPSPVAGNLKTLLGTFSEGELLWR